MLNHHPTVSDHYGYRSRVAANRGSSGQTLKLKTPAINNQFRQNQVTGSSSLLEKQRICAAAVPPSFPFYSSQTQIPLPYMLPRVYDASCLAAGKYTWQYPTVTPRTTRLNDVAMKTRSDVAAPFMATPTRSDIGSPLKTYFRGSVNGAPSNSRCANSHWFSATHSSSVMSVTTEAVTPNGETMTTTPRNIADSGIASRHRRQRAITPDAASRTRARRQQSRRSFLFTADRHASDDSSSTTSNDQRAASSPSPVVIDALTKQPQYNDVDEVADSTSMPTSDSAYSDADELTDIAERQ